MDKAPGVKAISIFGDFNEWNRNFGHRKMNLDVFV